MRTMFKLNTIVCLVVLTLALSAPAWAKPVVLKIADGSRWRGETGDLVSLVINERGREVEFSGVLEKAESRYVIVEGDLGKKVILLSDIVSISAGGAKPAEQADNDAGAKPGGDKIGATKRVRPKNDQKVDADYDGPGVFVLPLKGQVGTYVRHEEIEAIGKEADKYGRGQIIILLLETPGGLVTEMEQIHHTLVDLKKRHRVIAWIKEAISAGCATALHCDEIYFMTEGSAGAMTAFAGQTSWQGEELARWLRYAGDWAEEGGRSRYIAEAMIHKPEEVSYDKDPETGEVTWYDDTSGEFVLSDKTKNLVFTASTAAHSGFADGIADTEEELAALLNHPRWHEKSDYGRKIAKDWQDTVARAEREIPKLYARLNYEGTGSGDDRVILGKQIKMWEEMKSWWRRCPNVCRMNGMPPLEAIDRQIQELRRQLQRMNR